MGHFSEEEVKGTRRVCREVVRGPCLYKPRQPSEWTHTFSWHGHDPSGGSELARKRAHGLRFEKLLLGGEFAARTADLAQDTLAKEMVTNLVN